MARIFDKVHHINQYRVMCEGWGGTWSEECAKEITSDMAWSLPSAVRIFRASGWQYYPGSKRNLGVWLCPDCQRMMEAQNA